MPELGKWALRMTSRCAVGVVSDKYRFGDVGTLLDRPKWLRFKPALTI